MLGTSSASCPKPRSSPSGLTAFQARLVGGYEHRVLGHGWLVVMVVTGHRCWPVPGGGDGPASEHVIAVVSCPLGDRHCDDVGQ